MENFTIKDIARIAGVSTTAVSFVLNDRPGVSESTRQRVREIIERTGFIPNAHTRRLNLHRSFSIHVVLYWHRFDLFNQFALEIMHGIFHSSRELGYSITITFVDETMDCTALMESIRSKDCDGVILSQIEDPIFMARLQQEQIPFVCVDSHVKNSGDIPTVEVDYYNAALYAVRHLIACGHKQIGYLGMATPLEMRNTTFSGYTDALREAGLVCNPAWISFLDFTENAAEAYFDQLKQKDELPTAFFCPGDVFAIELAKTVQKNGLRIPEDISIVSVDDLVISRYLTPPLTTMTFDKEALGSCAVDLLYSILSEKPCERFVLIPTSLCKRESVLNLNG